MLGKVGGERKGKDEDEVSAAAVGSDALAIALRSEGQAQGTRVIAKGHGASAEQILDIAFKEGVKVRSDAELAQMLDLVDLDSDIPLEALAAVAEILTYLYRLNAAAGEEGAERE